MNDSGLWIGAKLENGQVTTAQTKRQQLKGAGGLLRFEEGLCGLPSGQCTVPVHFLRKKIPPARLSVWDCLDLKNQITSWPKSQQREPTMAIKT